jgi:predicted lipoprotein with Yx(FWY)xxD motif
MNILGFFNGRRSAVIVASFVAAALLSACSGSKTSSVTPAVYTTPPAVASATSASNTPVEQQVAGSYAWVNPTTSHTLYYLSNDTAYGGGCTGTCLQKWPPLYANAYAAPSGNFAIITRSDGTGKQWAYYGHPLYNFSGDTGPDQANGNGLAYNGGTWYIARPTTTASTSSPTPTATATPYGY